MTEKTEEKTNTRKFTLRNSTIIICFAITGVTVATLVGGPAIGGAVAGMLAPFVFGNHVYRIKKAGLEYTEPTP